MNTTYIPHMDPNKMDFSQDNHIIGRVAAKQDGIKMAEAVGEKTFYLMECRQYWPKVHDTTRALISEIEEDILSWTDDDTTLSGLGYTEIKELEEGLNKLVRQWLIRNNRVPNQFYLAARHTYKIKSSGKAVLVRSEEFD